MEKISIDEFRIWQPGYPAKDETDAVYCNIANKLLASASSVRIAGILPEKLLRRMALCITCYLQDIVADGGIWRSFVMANRELYGWSVPFHATPESYIDYELNREDVRFLTWYSIAMSYESMRAIYPHDEQLLELADLWFDILESVYDDAPEPESWHIARGLDLNDPEDAEQIYQLGNWIFLHCYLMTPAYALTLSDVMADPELLKPENITRLHDRIEQSMMEDPTGPPALFISEWIYLIIKGKLKNHKPDEGKNEIHPYYDKFTKYTGGKTLAFFDTYEKMNKFFIEALGWEAGEEHLPMMKNDRDFVLMVNKHKGMLAARNIARCIASPDNAYYDKEYAATHAFELLSVRGLCPGDLLHCILKNGWLPDASFPETHDTQLVKENADFIGRCYLQKYYRGD